MTSAQRLGRRSLAPSSCGRGSFDMEPSQTIGELRDIYHLVPRSALPTQRRDAAIVALLSLTADPLNAGMDKRSDGAILHWYR
jgi:hypothetical protein